MVYLHYIAMSVYILLHYSWFTSITQLFRFIYDYIIHGLPPLHSYVGLYTITLFMVYLH